jgi:hypothetical protein
MSTVTEPDLVRHETNSPHEAEPTQRGLGVFNRTLTLHLRLAEQKEQEHIALRQRREGIQSEINRLSAALEDGSNERLYY